jgi:hypothetical protein
VGTRGAANRRILLIAGLGWLLPDVSLLAVATGISVVTWIATAWLLAACWKKPGGNHLGSALVAVLLLTQSAGAATLGMEIALFQFLLVTTIYLYLSGMLGWTGLALGLLFLTRGEGILLGLLLLLWDRVSKKRIPWRLMGAIVAVVLVWSIYGLATFGNFLPSTLGTKIAQRESGLWRPFGERLFTEWLPGWFTGFPTSLVSVALIAGGVLYATRWRREWWMFLLWGAGYIVGYLIINPAGYWWYAMPVFFVFSVFTALGLAALPNLFGWLRGHGQWRADWLGVVVSALALLMAVGNVRTLRDSLLSYSTAFSPGQGRYTSAHYGVVAEWFVKHTEPKETVAYVEVGYLGYYTRNRFIDLAGLVTPGIADHLRSKDLTWGFLYFCPDYALIAPEFNWLMGAVSQLQEFKQSYRLVYQVERPGREPLSIYARLDSSYLRLHGEDTEADGSD